MLQFIKWWYTDSTTGAGSSSDDFPVWAIFFAGAVTARAATYELTVVLVHSLHVDRDRTCSLCLLLASQ